MLLAFVCLFVSAKKLLMEYDEISQIDGDY